MNKKILFVLALNWVLVGCAQAPASTEGPLAGCKTQGWWFCKGNPQAPTININTKSAKLKASPYCMKAVDGTQLVFRLTPAGKNPKNTVRIISKNDDHAWLNGTNSDFADMIIIDVPEKLPEGDYDYGIKIGDKCVDPRVRVER